MITENLEQVRKNIEEACRAVNRDPGEVTLISVSKTKPVSMLQEASRIFMHHCFLLFGKFCRNHTFP